ncbi:MAG: MarR family transcriptional regulator [Pedobacter sp.]|nr:MAG: MarR family transcriptional regulator [Pedobacter sp.]
MDLIKDLAELALATRLKRLSERLSVDVSKIYKESEVSIEARWFLLLHILEKNKVMAITEIADALQLSHPAIVQMVNELSEKKLITTKSDKNDARKRLISLSPLGKKNLAKLAPILASIAQENKRWIAEAEADILTTLEQLEKALDEQSMYQRIKLNLLQKNS